MNDEAPVATSTWFLNGEVQGMSVWNENRRTAISGVLAVDEKYILVIDPKT